jgi:hypothetical protein
MCDGGFIDLDGSGSCSTVGCREGGWEECCVLPGICMSKASDDIVRQKRFEANCENWKDAIVDATCECTGHGMMEIPCAESDVTLWESGGETCIVVTPDGDADWTKHAWYYPTTYGTECGLTPEPGSFACTSTDEGHAWENPSSMYDAAYGGEDWCAKEWCWVDVCSCTNGDMAKSSWGAGWYSYSTCGAADLYTDSGCTSKVMDECYGFCEWQSNSDDSVQTEACSCGAGYVCNSDNYCAHDPDFSEDCPEGMCDHVFFFS